MNQLRKHAAKQGSRLLAAVVCLAFARVAVASPSDFAALCGGKYDGTDSALSAFEAAGWKLASPEAAAEFSRSDFDADVAISLVDGSFGDLVNSSVSVRLAAFDVKEGMEYLSAARNFEGSFATQEETATKTSILLRLHKGEGAEMVFAELRFPKVYEKDKPLVCTLLTKDRANGLAFIKSLFPNENVEASPIWLADLKDATDTKPTLLGSVVLIDATALTEELGTELRAAMRLKIENADFRIAPAP